MEGEERSASQPAGTNGSQAKKPRLDASDSMDEVDEEAAMDSEGPYANGKNTRIFGFSPPRLQRPARDVAFS